jgi:hypothetical protein
MKIKLLTHMLDRRESKDETGAFPWIVSSLECLFFLAIPI